MFLRLAADRILVVAEMFLCLAVDFPVFLHRLPADRILVLAERTLLMVIRH
jgi:hypothetical protein